MMYATTGTVSTAHRCCLRPAGRHGCHQVNRTDKTGLGVGVLGSVDRAYALICVRQPVERPWYPSLLAWIEGRLGVAVERWPRFAFLSGLGVVSHNKSSVKLGLCR